MTPQAFQAFCLALPGATVSVQWGDDHVFKVGDKMFAVLGGASGAGGWSCKASDIAFEALVETGKGRPAPYLARAKWVAFDSVEALPQDETEDLLRQAHALIAAKLTRAVRRELGLA